MSIAGPATPATRAGQAEFGATVLPGGGVQFMLWAPGIAAPVLELMDDADAVVQALPMAPAAEEGWLQQSVPSAKAGTLYRYRFPMPDGSSLVAPDPASRCNPRGVHGPSQVVDMAALQQADVPTAWRGRPWHEAVVYELHLGTFTPAGTLAAAAARLPTLQQLGITAVELMPLAAADGQHGWGYDGVLPFAVHTPYGTPAELRAFVESAHALGLVVLLDVVYNHFGPDGNYMGAWCPGFFNVDVQTPWGPAIRFDKAAVRSFFVQNALHWVQGYGIDGLRLDAVHALHHADSGTHIIEDIAAALRAGPGRHRHVHLVLENDDNDASLLARDADGMATVADAQWNDDMHHAAHVLATGETQGYYADYADHADHANDGRPANPAAPLARALADGFIYQGQASMFRHGAARGQPSGALPSAAFVGYLQNHDQIGNRAFGERLDALAAPMRVEALLACLLLAPQVPMLFMGEEFAATTPFLYFCDFNADLGAAVAKGRRNEFAGFAAFADPAVRETIPDPNAPGTFEASKLHWADADSAAGQRRQALVRQLLAVRHQRLLPLLPAQRHGGCQHSSGGTLAVRWPLGSGATWQLRANFVDGIAVLPVLADEQVVFALRAELQDGAVHLQPDGVFVTLRTTSTRLKPAA